MDQIIKIKTTESLLSIGASYSVYSIVTMGNFLNKTKLGVSGYFNFLLTFSLVICCQNIMKICLNRTFSNHPLIVSNNASCWDERENYDFISSIFLYHRIKYFYATSTKNRYSFHKKKCMKTVKKYA